MKKLYILVIALVFFLGCKKEISKPDLPDISIVDISKDSDWNYWVVGKNDYYYIKAENSLPKSVLFHSSEVNKDYSIFFTEDGMPDKICVDNYIFVLRNFNGNKVDMGIIYPDGNIEILRQIDTNYDWTNLTALKSCKIVQEQSDAIRWTGRAVAGIPCLLSAAGALATAGALTPVVGWTCGNYLLGYANSLLTHELNIHNGITNFIDSYGNLNLGYGCLASVDLTNCLVGLAAKGLSIEADVQEKLENSKAVELQTTESALEYGYGDVQITLVWNNQADLDLHVFDPYNDEIWWKYKDSYSGGILDVDDTDGYGPENVYWPQGEAPSGNYEVYLNYYVWNNQPWRPLTSNYSILINAFGKIRRFTGTISLGETIHIKDFDQNGLKSVYIKKSKEISNERKINP